MDLIVNTIPYVIGFIFACAAAFKHFSHIGEKYNNAKANLRSDVRAIESQEVLNENLTAVIVRLQDQINLLSEKLDNERKQLADLKKQLL